ncbi:putative Ig domain-containing protein, partial [Geomesophilobacter sediminis]
NIVISAANAAGSAALPAFAITVALPLPPLPTISGTPATTVTAGQSYLFTPSATDAASFSISGKPSWGSFDSTTGALSGTPQSADAGSYPNIVISAMNAAGSTALAPFTITVTTPVTPPTLFLSMLADQSVTSNATLNISGRADCPNGFQSLTVNGASVPVSGDGSFTYAIALSEGVNTISAVLTDTTGLQANERRTIILDSTGPTITITAPADGSITPATSVTVAGTVSEPGTVSVGVNGAAPSAAAMNGTSFSATVPLAAGTNTIIVTMADQAGNSTVAKRTVISDQSKPSLAITDPGQDVTITQPSYLVKGTAGDAETATTVTIAVDGQTFTPALTNGAFEQAIVFAAEKQYAVVATATDQAGNSSTVQRNIIVTKAPSGAGLPSISGTPATSVTAGQSYLFTPSATGAASFTITSKPSWASFDTATGTLSGTPQNADAGTYSGIVISAVNSAGATALPAFSITVVSTLPPLPTISGTPATSVAAGENYRFTPTATGATSFTIANKPTWAAFDAATGTLSGTPGTADAGNYAGIGIGAVNAAGSAALPAFAIAVTTSAPPTSTPPTLTISTLADQSITNNVTLNVSGSVLCPNGLDSFTINGTAVTVNPDGSFTYAVTLTDGANIITAEVTDRAGYRKTDSRTIILDRTAPTITIATPADGSVTSASTASVTGTISEAGTVSVAVNGGAPVAATLTGTSFAATVQLASGSNTITVSTTDRAGNSATAKRTVVSDRTSPSLSITDPGQDITITRHSYLLKGSAGDADTLTTVTVAVDGLSFTPTLANGTFEQTLTFATEKQYSVVVTATDQGGNRATVQRNIVVMKPLKGDLNGDGSFDISDALKVYQAVMGKLTLTPEESAAADVAPLSAETGQPTGDNVVDIADVIIILRRIVGAVTW